VPPGSAPERTIDPPGPAGAVGDERLRLIFTCCHPALAMGARVALTLRMAGGLTVPEIARAFLVAQSATGRRITRAKARIKAAGIPYRVPSAAGLPARVCGVLAVLFLVFNEGYLAAGPGTDPVRHDLTAEAIRLTRLIRALLPQDGEAAGLLALMLLTEAARGVRQSHRAGGQHRRDRLPDPPPRPAAAAPADPGRNPGTAAAGPEGTRGAGHRQGKHRGPGQLHRHRP
jgi:RNA polymerase sigma-70 factor (ECF subfamily)